MKRVLLVLAIIMVLSSCNKEDVMECKTITSIIGNGSLLSYTFSDGSSSFDIGDGVYRVGDLYCN